MPLVTGVLQRRGKVKVFVDEEFWAELDPDVAADSGLREGAELSTEELQKVRLRGERPLAMNRALNILSYRARAKGELHERLLRANYSSQTVSEVLARLEALGYLDDEDFARDVVRAKARKYGPRRILVDLHRAGVDEGIAREAVQEKFEDLSELEAALEIVRRRYNTKEDPTGAQARRVYGFLMRRGYSAGVCAEVARTYRQETEE